MEINFSTNIRAFSNKLTMFKARLVPEAVARSLTEVAMMVRDAEKANESKRLDRPRPFTLQTFVDFMLAQSTPLLDSIAVVRQVRTRGGVRLFTLNNESKELHEYRVRTFQLDTVFLGFLTSCYMGQTKPDEGIYLSALGIASCRGALDSLMAEVLEGHIRSHIADPKARRGDRDAAIEQLIDVIRAYLK